MQFKENAWFSVHKCKNQLFGIFFLILEHCGSDEKISKKKITFTKYFLEIILRNQVLESTNLSIIALFFSILAYCDMFCLFCFLTYSFLYCTSPLSCNHDQLICRLPKPIDYLCFLARPFLQSKASPLFCQSRIKWEDLKTCWVGRARPKENCNTLFR